MATTYQKNEFEDVEFMLEFGWWPFYSYGCVDMFWKIELEF